MLIATQGKSVSATQDYFEQVLTQGDYYLGQEIPGNWNGKGCQVLGLGENTQVTKEQFNRLLEGTHPVTGETLTQRNRQDRRPGMDLTFSVPKSVSLAWAINDDRRIELALRESVHETMQRDVEPLMQRRVRSGEHASTRQKTPTGKLIFADFLHKTSRPVDGIADPHLHIHSFVINWTEENGKHYAGEMEEIVRQRPSLQAKFEARLARKLQKDLGYQVEHTRYLQGGRSKTGWELKGISRQTIEKYSRRTQQVEQVAREHGITDAHRKASLGKTTREKKDTGKPIDYLREEWRKRLSSEERMAFARLEKQVRRHGQRQQGRETPAQLLEVEQEAAEQSIRYALDHHLYRQSTTERHQIVAAALEHGLTLSPERVEETLDGMKLIERSTDDEGTERKLITTRKILRDEQRLISFARDGRGTRKCIGDQDYEFNREWLDEQQKDAVRHVLTSRDTVMAVTGGAGTGKSSLLEETRDAIEQNGKQLHAFAPSTGAREVLVEKGFSKAQTVQHLIKNSELQASLKDQVMWIDEAGLLDVSSTNALFDIAKQQNARIVLSGDTRQHSSPRRGEAMRLLETEAGLNIARVEQIQRQKGQYRTAVELVSRGHEIVHQETGKTGLLMGFDMLNDMGKVKEIDGEQRHVELANEYISVQATGKTALVISPTHAEGQAVTQEIRSQLKKQGQLPQEDQTILQLRSLNLSEAEKRQAVTYMQCDGQDSSWVVQFHQNCKGGFKRGERYTVAEANSRSVWIQSMDGTRRTSLPLQDAERFEVYRQSELSITAGDKIRFSLGGKAKNGKTRISNGRLDEVAAIDGRGDIILKNGTTIDSNYGHLDLGYVVTSHASQGKDRQVAICSMGSESMAAINAKQFYVSVSRGREDVRIFVDDISRTRHAIQKSGEQLSATELVRSNQEESTLEHSSHHHDRRQQQTMDRSGTLRSFRDRLQHWWQDRGQQLTQQAGDAFGRSMRLGPAGNSPSPSGS